MINGTQFICAIGAQAIHKANGLCDTADVIASVSIEALKGSILAFSPEVHNARPHNGKEITRYSYHKRTGNKRISNEKIS